MDLCNHSHKVYLDHFTQCNLAQEFLKNRNVYWKWNNCKQWPMPVKYEHTMLHATQITDVDFLAKGLPSKSLQYIKFIPTNNFIIYHLNVVIWCEFTKKYFSLVTVGLIYMKPRFDPWTLIPSSRLSFLIVTWLHFQLYL